MRYSVATLALFVGVLYLGSAHAEEKFKPTIESLRQYECPEWFRDAKFGIYLHWGAYSVAEQGEWYARKLYDETTPEYKHHLEHYGHPSEFGMDRLQAMTARLYGATPQQVSEALRRAVRGYCAPSLPHDDCTMIALRYLG